jgi:raffinose/stachyose/melibiose transport system permease protein
MGRMSAIINSIFGRRLDSTVLNHVILSLLVVFALAPVVLLGFNSLKSRAEIGLNPLGPPETLRFENFPNAWNQGAFEQTVKNSVTFVLGTVAMELVLGGLAAYSLARKSPPGGNLVMLYMLVMSTVPIWLYLVPLFFLWKTLNLLNSYIGMILIYTALNAPFSIFLLRSYMIGLPSDFEDAARVDGANELQIITKVVLPLTWPGFLTVGLIVGLGIWGEFQIALIFISDPNMFPVTTSYHRFQERFGTDWALTSAAAFMMILPVLILFLSLQRRFIKGLTKGGLKL